MSGLSEPVGCNTVRERESSRIYLRFMSSAPLAGPPPSTSTSLDGERVNTCLVHNTLPRAMWTAAYEQHSR